MRVHLSETSSTNDDVKARLGRQGLDWVVVTADRQTGGRGQYARQWVSDIGGLYFSMGFPFRSCGFQLSPHLTFSLAQCVQRSIFSLTGSESRIEWPNDLIVNYKKMAGFLVERVVKGGVSFWILGIGVNVNQSSFPGSLAYSATSLFLETGKTVSLSQFTNLLIGDLLIWRDSM